MPGGPGNRAIAAAKAQRQRDRQALALLRRYRQDRSTVVLDPGVAGRLLVLASRMLTARCELTGEDPAAVLDTMEAEV